MQARSQKEGLAVEPQNSFRIKCWEIYFGILYKNS